MSNETKRMNYSDGLLLKQEDLTLDQDYHIKQQRLHNGSFHEWGVVDGLEIEVVQNLPQIKVKPGLALNKVLDTETNMMISQEIWICEDHPDNPINLGSYDIDTYVYIYVTYREVLADIDSTKAGDKEIHIWERAEIKATDVRPENPREKVIIACVKIGKDKDNNKIIDENQIYYDYFLDAKGEKVTVRTYAVSDGNTKEFGQIRIGNKERINLPHIDGKIENGKDGLEVNSPFTNFTGKVTSDGLLTSGEAEINGTLTVKANNKKAIQVNSQGNVMIDTEAAVSGKLSASGGMVVTGGNTSIETTTVSLTANLLTINNNTNNQNSINDSGVIVYRGKDEKNDEKPQAKLIWNEKQKCWQAGTEKKEDVTGSGVYNLLYGSDWESMKNGSISDDYHKHSVLCGPEDRKERVKITSTGNVEISTSAEIPNGALIVKDGIQAKVDLEEGSTTPKLFWNAKPNEDDKIGHWQITDNNGGTYNIAYGDSWDQLTQEKDADAYHHHGVVCTRDGKVAINVNDAGNTEVSNNLTVKKDLVVDGNISVLGEGIQSIKMEQVVTEKTIIVNKTSDVKQLAAEGGLEVYRGEGLENAKLIWDEGSNKWKVGTGDALTELPSGIKWENLTGGGLADDLHNHNNIYSEDGLAVISVNKDTSVDIDGDITASKGLYVEKDAQIKGALKVDGSVIFNGDITVTGKETVVEKEIVKVNNSSVLVNQYKSQAIPIENEGGLEVYRGGNTPNARLVWNELDKEWKIGLGKDLQRLPCGENWDTLTENYLADGMHKHSKLFDTKGKTAIEVNTNGDVNIGNDTYVNGEVLVDGSLKVNGKLTVEGITEYVNKESIVSNESIISLNSGTDTIANKGGIEIFRGDKPKARFIWDENSKVWKVGIGENLRDINPIQLYNDRGDILALSVRTSGNVDVAHDLLVGQDLTIVGCLDVRGQRTRINSPNIEISGNSIVLNRFDEGTLAEHSNDSGITVFRGNGKDIHNAALFWNEKDASWKFGLAGTEKFFRVEANGIVNSDVYKVQDILSIDSIGIFSKISTGYEIGVLFGQDRWRIGKKSDPGLCVTADGCVGIANVDPQVELDVNGNANINGSLTINKGVTIIADTDVEEGKDPMAADLTGNVDIDGSTTVSKNVKVIGAASVGSLTVGDNISFTPNGIEIKRDTDANASVTKQPAKILWNENKGCWMFGSGEKYVELSVEGKDAQNLPSELWTINKEMVVVKTNDKGYVGIGVITPTKKLDVGGDAQIQGNLLVNSINSKDHMTANSFKIPRAGDSRSAILQWDEGEQSWQAGIEGDVHTLLTGSHIHNQLNGKTTSIIIEDSGKISVGSKISFNDGTIRAASVIAAGNIDSNNTTVTEKLTTKDADISNNATINGTLTVGASADNKANTAINCMLWANKGLTVSEGATVTGTLTANSGLTVNGGLIKYDASNGWQATKDGTLKQLCFKEEIDKLNNIGADKLGNLTTTISVGTTIENGIQKKTTTLSSDVTNVNGSLFANGGLTVYNGATVNGTLTASDALTVSKTATVTGALTANGGLTVSNGATITGSLTANDALTVSKTATVTGALTASGGLTVSNGAAITGTLTANGGLTVSNGATVTGALTANDALTVSKTATVAGMLTANGGLTVLNGAKVTGTLTANDALTVSKTATVTGTLTASGGLSVSNGATVNGALTANGGLTVSNGATVSGVLNANGGLSVSAGATVTGNLTANDALTVSKTATVTGMLTANGGLTVNGELTVSGAVQANEDGFKSKINDTTTAQIVYDATDGWKATKGTGLKQLLFTEDIADIRRLLTIIEKPDETSITVAAKYTNFNGSLTANGTFVTGKSATVGENLTVTGNATVNGKISVNNGIEMKSGDNSYTLNIKSDGGTYKLELIVTKADKTTETKVLTFA